jgi:hypothetical protein
MINTQFSLKSQILGQICLQRLFPWLKFLCILQDCMDILGPAQMPVLYWLVTQKRCWTTDRLTKQGLDHPKKCLLCDQEAENIDHLLVTCVFAREFWYLLLRQFGLHSCTIDGCFLLSRLVGKESRSSERAYQKGPQLPYHLGCLGDLESLE